MHPPKREFQYLWLNPLNRKYMYIYHYIRTFLFNLKKTWANDLIQICNVTKRFLFVHRNAISQKCELVQRVALAINYEFGNVDALPPDSSARAT